MAQTLLRFGEGSYGLRVGEHVYKFRPDEGGSSHQELREKVSAETIAWYHASSVFPAALPALAVHYGREVPYHKTESIQVDYDLSKFFFDAFVSYGRAEQKTAFWKQAPALVVTAWVENNTPIARTQSDLSAAVQYAACTGVNEYVTVDHFNRRETKHVDCTFFSTHVLPKLKDTVVLEERDGGILVYKANEPREHMTEYPYKCKVWTSGGQISACWY